MDPSKVEVLEGNGKDGDACPHSSGPSSKKMTNGTLPLFLVSHGRREDSDTSPHPIGPWPNKCNQDRKETPNKSVIQQTCQTIFFLFFLVTFLVRLLLLLPRNNITAEKPAERERSELFLSFYLGFSSRSPPVSFIDSYYYCSIFFSFFLFFGYVNY